MASSLNGTGLTFSSGATLNSPPVTSVATGNGLTGGTITTTGTISIAAPSAGSVGSYSAGGRDISGSSGNWGSTYSTIYTMTNPGTNVVARGGTWMCLGWSGSSSGWNCNSMTPQLWVRVA